MSFYLKKFLPYKALSLLFVVLADVFLCGAICFCFADATFGADYYNWLKIIDIACVFVLLFAILLGLVLMTPNMLLGEPKSKKIIHLIFDIIQIFMLIILFVNFISFYENIEHILFLICLGAFLLSQIIIMIGNMYVDKYMMIVDDEGGNLFGISPVLRVATSSNKEACWCKLEDITSTTKLKNFAILPCIILNILGYVAIGVVGTLILNKNGVLLGQNLAWYVIAIMMLVVLCVLSGFLIKLYGADAQYAHTNRWMCIILLCANTLFLMVISILMYFYSLISISTTVLFVLWVYLLIPNYLLLKEYIRQKYLYKYIIRGERN